MKRACCIGILGLLIAGCQSWRGDETTAQPSQSSRSTATSQRTAKTEQQAQIPAVKEELQVGKRQIPSETREEPVVSKRPRVTEEVTLRQEAGEHSETTNESIQSTDDEVQGSQEVKASMGLSRYEQEFLQHYTSHFSDAGSYDEYRPAYHYGYGLATRGRGNWSEVESEAQRNWEDQHPGSWDRFRAAIQYGWEKAKQGKG
jgi:hypothetical protein